jgi:hypothetical protein
MGVTFTLPGMTPEALNTKEFRDFWVDLTVFMHGQMSNLHEAIFASKFNEVGAFVLQRLSDGNPIGEDCREYNDFFVKKTENVTGIDTGVYETLSSMFDQGILHKPPGWSGSLAFNKEDNTACLTVTIGAIHAKKGEDIEGDIKGLGPVEGLCLGLDRPTEGLLPDDMVRRVKRYKNTARKAFRNLVGAWEQE